MAINLEQIGQLQCTEESLKKFDINVKDKRELVSLVNETFGVSQRKCARTTKEKFEVLDLRDKVLKLIRYELMSFIASGQSQSTIDLNTLVGTAADMCPEKERYRRIYLALCHKYESTDRRTSNKETDNGADGDGIDHMLMVKEYSRSSADQDLPLPNELRPLKVLYETMAYLINSVIPDVIYLNGDSPYNGDSFPVGDWYDFVWNRTRSIRKDIIQQRLLTGDACSSGQDASASPVSASPADNPLAGVLIIEQCARFHIMCAYLLCEQSSEVFDFKINEENLKNCFQSLRQFYQFSAAANQSAESAPSSNVFGGAAPTNGGSGKRRSAPNEAEFRSYAILLNLNESNILGEIQRWPENIRHSPEVRFALKVYFTYNSRNFIRFFRLIRSDECNFLHACILHRYFHQMRCDAFRVIFTSYREQAAGNRERLFPLSKLTESLGFDSQDDAMRYCGYFGLRLQDDDYIQMPSSANNSCFKLTERSVVEELKFARSHSLVDTKFESLQRKLAFNQHQSDDEDSMRICVSKVIRGQWNRANHETTRLGSEHHELQSSFDDEGCFVGHYEINELLKRAEEAGMFVPGARAKALKKVQSAKLVVKSLKQATAGTSESAASEEKAIISPAAKIALKRASSLVKKATINSRVSSQKLSIGDAAAAAPGETAAAKLPGAVPIKEKRRLSSGSTGKKQGLASTDNENEGQKKPNLFAAPPTVDPTQKPKMSFFSAFPASGAQNVQESAKLPPSHAASAPTFGLFSKPASTAPDQKNPFSSMVGAKPPQSAFGAPAFGQGKAQAMPFFGQPALPGASGAKNPFESIIMENQRKPDEKPQPVPASSDDSQSKVLDQIAEITYQNMVLELCKNFCQEFIFKNKVVAGELADQLLAEVADRCVREETANSIRRQQNQSYFGQVILTELCDTITRKTCHEFLEELMLERIRYMERLKNEQEAKRIIEAESEHMFDLFLYSVFQLEFESILKEIAREMNEDLKEQRMNQIAESIYFMDESDPLTALAVPQTPRVFGPPELADMSQDFSTSSSLSNHDLARLSNNNSIFMVDLRQFMHECIFESTRLNLNVNSELHNEICQAIEVNELKYLLRKWRLKTSLRLLHSGYRRNSLIVQQQQLKRLSNESAATSAGQQSDNSSSALQSSELPKSLHQQLQLMSFMSTYGNYLIKNFNRLQSLQKMMLFSADAALDRGDSTQRSSSQVEIVTNKSLVHCEDFLMHLTWHLNINYSHEIYELLFRNYFDIIHSKSEVMLQPPPLVASSAQSPLNQSSQLIIGDSASRLLAVNHVNHELFVKTVVGMPKLLTKRAKGIDEDIEGIKRWLMSKMFRRFESNEKSAYETQHVETLSLNLLQDGNSYGARYCVKLFPIGMSQTELSAKLAKRSYYGANSLIYVLMPFDDEGPQSAANFQRYLQENQSHLHSILRSFNENVQLRLQPADRAGMSPHDIYDLMFVSYLGDHAQTTRAIEHLLGLRSEGRNGKHSMDQNLTYFVRRDQYCYCLLEGDVLRDDLVIQESMSLFIEKVCRRQATVLQSGAASGGLSDSTILMQKVYVHDHVNHVSSLANIFDSTLAKFFQYLTHWRHCLYLPFDAIVEEYNKRLSILIEMLTRDEYRLVAWPVPELTADADAQFKTPAWSPVYWNTNEAFDGLIRRDVFNLMKLNSLKESLNCEEPELISFKELEVKIFNYAQRLVAHKSRFLEQSSRVATGKQAPRSSASEGWVSLQGSLLSIIQNMKKSNSGSSSSSLAAAKAHKRNKLLQMIDNEPSIPSKSVDWSQFLFPIVKYLLVNSSLTFRQEPKTAETPAISLDQLAIYHNKSELKTFDWINCCVHSASRSPSVRSECREAGGEKSSDQATTSVLFETYARENHGWGVGEDGQVVRKSCIFCNNRGINTGLLDLESKTKTPLGGGNLKRRISDESFSATRLKSDGSVEIEESNGLESAAEDNNWSLMINVNEMSHVHSLTNGLTDAASEQDYFLNQSEDSNRTSPSRHSSLSFSNATMSPLSASLVMGKLHQSKYQKLAQEGASPTSSSVSNQKASAATGHASTEFDAKIKQFFDIMSREKENQLKFETRLELARSVPPGSAAGAKSVKEAADKAKTPSVESSLAKLDEFFSLLKEEKNKNEKLNMKLTDMLGES